MKEYSSEVARGYVRRVLWTAFGAKNSAAWMRKIRDVLTGKGGANAIGGARNTPAVLPFYDQLPLMASRTHIVCAAAERDLGYRARVSLKECGARTAAWAQWARCSK